MASKRFSLRRFIRRAALITCVLALVETVLIFFFMNGKKEKGSETFSGIKKSQQPTPIDTLQEVDKLKADTSPYTSPAPTETDSLPVIKYDDTHQPSSALNSVSHAENALLPADSLYKMKKPGPTTVRLSKAGMAKILKTVINKKRVANSRSNCVQIRKTTKSNVVNAFDLAAFLKSKGYIISGRSTVGGDVKGISVNAGGTCVSVTIGCL